MRRAATAALLALPVLWVVAAHLLPLLALAQISALSTYPLPPGTPAEFSLGAYGTFIAQPAYMASLGRSLLLAAATTALALVCAYPLAYVVARRVPPHARGRRLLLLVAPFWTSEVLRMFALVLLLSRHGAIDSLLAATGLPALRLLYTDGAVLAGILYSVLLSMLLPLYAALDRLPADVLEAATDLGASAWARFRDVTLPLTARGIAAGCTLTFLASLGVLAAPTLLGGPTTPVFAVTIAQAFGAASGRWPLGAAFGFILLLSGIACASVALRPLRLRRA